MLAVVFVHYRLPEKRLRDHFRWNEKFYQDAKVYVVAERVLKVPEYAECVVLQEDQLPKRNGKPIFSLSATKNIGIAQALVDRRGFRATTDTDVAWTQDAWAAAVLSCDEKTAVVPVYRMAQTYETRLQVSHPDHGCGGTVVMTADNWRRVAYDERYIGYGGEDGKLRRDAAAIGIAEYRNCDVFHIAHDSTQPQANVPGAGRGDCWNRDSGFNPDNWKVNRGLINA